ncbi:hypothetical protein Tco_1001536, partial [Tanacetum coccineum]
MEKEEDNKDDSTTKLADTRIRRHENLQAHELAGTRIGRHTNSQAHKFAGKQIRRHMNSEAHELAGTRIRSFNVVRIRRGKCCEKNYSSVRRYVADPDNAYPKRSITKLILKGAVVFDVVSYQFRCALNYSKLVRKLWNCSREDCYISRTKYYKDDSCWSADLKSNTTEDVISIGSFMEVLVLNHYVLVRKILNLSYWFTHTVLSALRRSGSIYTEQWGTVVIVIVFDESEQRLFHPYMLFITNPLMQEISMVAAADTRQVKIHSLMLIL